ncbi:MAG: ABC transporter permease, partial [Kiritimatiellaceae bacterium]|nr:ABC transporter permease [Kiritimatiellaceae bacterium]
MSVFFSLFKKELRMTFYSPIAYVVMFFFWALSGGNFIWLLWQLGMGESITVATQYMFGGPVLTFALPVIIPLITMRLFSEERKLGTLEALLTTSVKVPELVLAKFFGAWVFYLTLWLPVLVYAVIQGQLVPGDLAGFPDVGALRAGLLGVMLVGGAYLSVGVLLSSLTSNQIVAAIGGFALLFGSSIAFTIMAYSAQSTTPRVLGLFFSPFAHMMDFSRGIVDSRVVVTYLAYTV